MSSRKLFVKSAGTDAPVANSKAAIEKMLIRYGASAFQVMQDYAHGRVVISFTLPNGSADRSMIPVEIPIDILRVFNALYTKDTYTLADALASNNAHAWQKAERVAWRNLVLWIDAALSASSIGLQSISEAFFAHTLIDGERVIEACVRELPSMKRLLSGAQ